MKSIRIKTKQKNHSQQKKHTKRKTTKKPLTNKFNTIYKYSNNLKNLTKLSKGSRTTAVKKVWEYINKSSLKGKSNEMLKHNGKTYKGGQVILCKTDVMKRFSGNKNKIAMTQIAQLISKQLEDLDDN